MVQNIVCIAYGALKLCVDTSFGGHVVEFSLDGHNALATTTSAYGSTFWPSPQTAWGWPPLADLDNLPYTVVESEKELILTSNICRTTGLQVRKRFEIKENHVNVSYTMINTTGKAVHYAPWEITRIHGGITFYRSTDKPLDISTGEATLKDGYVWHEYNPLTQKQNEKIFGNGSSGWLANINNGLVLVKRFERVAVDKTAPGEAEIEIYAHGDPENAYIEMEQQGAFETIESQHSYEWKVEWYLNLVPKGVDATIGNPLLPKIVESVLPTVDIPK